MDWASVGGVQSHNFSLLIADAEADLLCKEIESLGLLLDVSGRGEFAHNCNHKKANS